MHINTARMVLLAALGASVLLTGCGGGDGTPTAPAGAATAPVGAPEQGYPIDSVQGGDVAATALPLATLEGYPEMP
jgi:hypothetical protein